MPCWQKTPCKCTPVPRWAAPAATGLRRRLRSSRQCSCPHSRIGSRTPASSTPLGTRSLPPAPSLLISRTCSYAPKSILVRVASWKPARLCRSNQLWTPYLYHLSIHVLPDPSELGWTKRRFLSALPVAILASWLSFRFLKNRSSHSVTGSPVAHRIHVRCRDRYSNRKQPIPWPLQQNQPSRAPRRPLLKVEPPLHRVTLIPQYSSAVRKKHMHLRRCGTQHSPSPKRGAYRR